MATTVKMIIQIRRDTAANWEQYGHLIPANGEPCFITDRNILKIGDGVTTFENLEPINGVQFITDDNSLVLEDGVLKLKGFDDAEDGAQLVKGEDGTIKWVVPSNEAVDGLQTIVGTLQTDVSTIKTNVSTLQGEVSDLKTIVGSAGEGSGTLLSRIEELEKDVDAFITGVTDNDEKINTLKELIEYVDEHGKEAADMASSITTLYDLVGGKSVNEQILAVVGESEKKAKALYEHVKYEVSHKPAGTLVDYRDKEIRVMVPAGTKFELQNSGANANANAYYIGFKAYAPDGAVSFKEDNAEIIADQTMYTFEGNEFAGVDAYGRKYSIVWLPVANYDGAVWTYYGVNSSKNHYIGWYYSVEWYDANGVKIGSDCIRINLSNESCHNNVEPFYMENFVRGVSVNGTLLDMVDGKVDVAINNVIKSSDEIEVAEDGSLRIKSISFDKVMQAEDQEVVLNGGGAAG